MKKDRGVIMRVDEEFRAKLTSEAKLRKYPNMVQFTKEMVQKYEIDEDLKFKKKERRGFEFQF